MQLSIVLMVVIAAAWWFVPHPLIPIIAGLGVLVGPWLLRQPLLLCLAFFAFSFFRLHEAYPALMPLRIPQLLSLGALAALAFQLFITRGIEPFWTPTLTSFAAFFACVTIGIAFATNKPLSIEAYTGSFIKIAIMVFAISWAVRYDWELRLLPWTLVICGLAIAYVTIYNSMNGIGLVEGTRVTVGRDVDSVLGDPNDLALVLLFPLSFAAILARDSTMGMKVLAAGAALILCYAILCTQSRGGLLGICAVLGVAGWPVVKRYPALLALAPVAVVALLAGSGIMSRGTMQEEGIDESSMGRLWAWQAAFRMALANPMTGVGLENFYLNYFFYSSHWDGKNHAVHSTWFQIMAETGFFGFSVFVTMIVMLFRRVGQSARILERVPNKHAAIINNAARTGLVSFCVSGTFLTQGFLWPLYTLFGIVVGVGALIDRSERNAAAPEPEPDPERASAPALRTAA